MSLFNNAIIGASSQGGYQISRSVRTRASASAYFGRTPASASNRTTWTWSGWVKRGALSTSSVGGVFGIFGGGTLGVSQSNFVCYFNSGYDIYLQETVNNVSNQLIYQTTSIYRDPTAWYQVIVAMDTTQATATNRVKIYVNGVQAPGAFSVTPGQNQALSINNNVPQYIGGASVNPQAYGNVLGHLDGYLAEVHFVDGQQLTPSSFGETDTITGVWKPKKYTGTYGTNGYYLKFSDNSNNTAATIGKDYSGNGNNWTPNNISVTAGTTYDSMLDVPTPFAGGGNGCGNYPTWNPLTAGGLVTFSEGNLKALSTASTAPFNIESTIKTPTSGKWYAEVTMAVGASSPSVGLGNNPSASTSNTDQFTCYRANATYTTSGMGASSTGTPATFTTNDVVGIAYDAGAGTLVFYKNGTLQAGGFTGITPDNYSFIVRKDSASGDGGFLNCGQRPFAYTPPAGFNALNTQNLPTPTISNGARYMAATTYTGTGASLAVSNAVNGISFQPDLVWTKVRNNTYSNHLEDAVRGVGQRLLGDSTVVEATGTNGKLTTFNSNGFTQDGGVEVGASTAPYVAWQWNAGGSTVTNTSGSISAQVRASPTAGFSIVTYTGTGANATVGHGLGVAPKMIILKPRSIVSSWIVWHTSFAGTEYIVLESSAAKATLAAMWNSTTPTSSVFSIGTNANVNQNAATFVAYCFSEVAGYSKFGTYIGNGAVDGPFVYLGFRPRFVLIKGSGFASNWNIYDSGRDTYNITKNALRANLSAAEFDGSAQGANSMYVDFTSNGFKLRYSGSDFNTNGQAFIYAAFAENPFKNSLAR